MKHRRSIDRRTFLKDSITLGIAAAGVRPAYLWAGDATASARDYPLRPLPVQDVEVDDVFWSPRIEVARTVSLPFLLDRQSRMMEHIDPRLIEGTAWFLSQQPQPALVAQTKPLFDPLVASMRSQMGVWRNDGDGPFLETGHFFEAAVAWHQATGDAHLLNVAVEVANDLNRQYGPGKRTDISNHEGIELSLVKLYMATDNDQYLRLAKFIVETRGTTAGGRTRTGPYAQDHEPVLSQQRAIGHCVRATYLYCAVTDLAARLPEATSWQDTASRIWDDAVAKRTYLTGGIGSYRRQENYGDDYDVPNLSCWNEICAAVGNTLWNRRMFQLTGDGRYTDVMEKILYNGLSAGVSQSGDKFLYQTPLRTHTEFARQTAFGPNCCPPNITRLLAQFGTLIYARDAHSLYVNLFAGSKARFEVDGRRVSVTQKTKYPWEGSTEIQVRASSPVSMTLNVRIPGWARGEAIPGNLYRFEGVSARPFSLLVNGKPAQFTLKRGYAQIEREWSANDVVELEFPMQIQAVRADDRVAEDRGMAALQRGPVVFCAERIDNKDGVFNLILPDAAKLQFSNDANLLSGIGTLRGPVERISREGSGSEVQTAPAELVAIPYYAFGNRGGTEMAVWLARGPGRAVIAPVPTIASTSAASSSCGNGTVADNYPGHHPPTPEKRMYPTSQDGSGHIAAIADQLEPVGSEDGSAPFLRLRPQSGNAAWVQYDFAAPAAISSVSVYWKDDNQFCVAPEKWSLLFRDGDQWRPVETAQSAGVERDTYNTVRFSPVHTNALRMEITLQGRVYRKGEIGPPDANYLESELTWYEGGIIEWKVNDDPIPATAVFPSYHAAADHPLDADPNSDFWKPAAGIVLDRSITGQPDPSVRSEARSRWSDEHLYFLFWGPWEVLHLKPDPDTVHETFKLWFYDDFELYLGSNFDNINLYGEFQISPQSEFLDQAIDASVPKPGWGNEHLWDSGMKVKSRIDRERKIWYGEMSIPIAAIDKRPPAVGNEFRVNVYRLQSAGEGKKIHFLAWQPTGEWNPHRPKKFGLLKLMGAPGGSA